MEHYQYQKQPYYIDKFVWITYTRNTKSIKSQQFTWLSYPMDVVFKQSKPNGGREYEKEFKHWRSNGIIRTN